eukprot:gnl/Dysnectes_brevis/927_a1032_2158.p1 GENE.gnl/Dysnectes_brevis/927_a1032_2158~~gnl/Dysnectes_brevis/927_a1032_2158.p1  ORF type:complete len:249 (-),score=47.11 gnl/Dysnectes_brevis/927_a1032_2158:966-1712(-)
MDAETFPLQKNWTLWFSGKFGRKGAGKKKKPVTLDDYTKNVHKIGSFDSALEFWRLYHLMPSFAQTQHATFHYFHSDIDPKWEHPANSNGYTLKYAFLEDGQLAKDMSKKADFDARFLSLLFTCIGGTEPLFNEYVNGVLAKVRPTCLTMQIWTKEIPEDALHELKGIISSFVGGTGEHQIYSESNAKLTTQARSDRGRSGSRRRGGSRSGSRSGSRQRSGSRSRSASSGPKGHGMGPKGHVGPKGRK